MAKLQLKYQSEDLFFFRDHQKFGRKIAKLQLSNILKKEARARWESS